MLGGPSALFSVILLSLPTLAAAQDPTPTTYPAPPSLCASFDVTAGTVQHIVPTTAGNGDVAATVELGGRQYTMALSLFEVRAPGFQLLRRDATGLHLEPTPPCVTYRGSLLEDPSTWVAATYEGQGLSAIVHFGNGTEYGIQPVAATQRNAGPAAHIVYRTTDNTNLPWTCGTTGGTTGPVNPPLGLDLSYVCEIALEADPAFYQLNGSSVVTTQNDMTAVINAVGAIYTNDVNLSYQITQILVNTTGNDPYTTSVAGSLLSEFQGNWNSNHAGIARDVAHLFTGRPMGQASGGAIGIAFLSTICSLGSAYGVSQSRFSNNMTRRAAVTAHELGHNFSAGHCDGAAQCFIMCSGIGGCNNVLTTFSPNVRTQISGYMQNANCLRIIPNQPVITASTPAQVQAFAPGQLRLTGSGFLGTTQVQLGSQVVTSGFSTTGDTILTIQLPQPTQLGPISVQTSNTSGTSNAVSVSYVATSPMQMNCPLAVLGGSTLTWSIGGTPGNAWVVLVSPVGTTTPFLGWPILDQADVFSVGFLSPSVGLGSQSVVVPAGVLSGQRFYSQTAELLLGATNLTVVSSTAVKSTLVVN